MGSFAKQARRRDGAATGGPHGPGAREACAEHPGRWWQARGEVAGYHQEDAGGFGCSESFH